MGWSPREARGEGEGGGLWGPEFMEVRQGEWWGGGQVYVCVGGGGGVLGEKTRKMSFK